MRLLHVGTEGMPPTTLAMDTREEDEEDPEVVEEEKEESKDGVPFFTGDWKWQSSREKGISDKTVKKATTECLRRKVYCELWTLIHTDDGAKSVRTLQAGSHREQVCSF